MFISDVPHIAFLLLTPNTIRIFSVWHEPMFGRELNPLPMAVLSRALGLWRGLDGDGREKRVSVLHIDDLSPLLLAASHYELKGRVGGADHLVSLHGAS